MAVVSKNPVNAGTLRLELKLCFRVPIFVVDLEGLALDSVIKLHLDRSDCSAVWSRELKLYLLKLEVLW